MSEIRVNNITNRDGTAGPSIAGIPVVDSNSHFVVPTGRTGQRYADNGENIVRDGLVLYLDAKYSYPGATGTNPDVYTWYDMSGNENNGELKNGVSYSGTNGGSLVFDGSNDYVNLGKAPSISQFSSFSVTCWVKPLSFPSAPNEGKVIIRNEQLFRIYWYQISDSSTNKLYFYTQQLDNGDLNTSPSYLTSNFSTNTWYNISATYTGSSTNLYINGILVDTKTGKSGNVFSNVNLYLGYAVDVSAYPFQGNIAQVSIYNRALTASEVLQNYNATKSRFQ
jgi:hypothetical protein